MDQPINAAPQETTVPSSLLPHGAPAGAAPFTLAAAMTTQAQAWLESIGPALDRIKDEERALAELHSAHVEAWLSAEACDACEDYFRADQLVRLSGYRRQCRACRDAEWSVRGMYAGMAGRE